MTYNEQKARKALKEAIEVSEKCDAAGDLDCEECPIGKPIEMVAHDSGVKIVASVCSMISALKNVCYEPKEYKYKAD